MNRSTTLTPKQREDWMAHRWSSPTYAVMCAELVDALLAHVFQGKKRRIRNHMLGVCAKVSRHWGKPWMDSQLERTWREGAHAIGDKVVAIAKNRAIVARAKGGDEERHWLDLIHAIEADLALMDEGQAEDVLAREGS